MKNKKLILIVIIILLIVGISSVGIWFYLKANKVVTIVALDINPSMKISLNYKNKVIKVEGVNGDGKELLKDNKIKGKSLEVAIKDISKRVIEKGYITESDNHILINVEGSNIKEEVLTLINNEFKEKNIECNVITQEIDESAKVNAEKYGISESKASYIDSIIKENGDITFEELKDKSINEINIYIETKKEEKLEETKKQEEEKKEENKENTSMENNNSSNNNSSSNKKPVTKPVSTPPASNDRTGAWCEFYKTIPPEGGVEYITPGYINDLDVYREAAKKIMPEDADWSSYFRSITEYKTASYCSAGIVELENYDKTKTYTAYLDSVTLELLELKTKEIEKPNIDEAGAKVIVTKWLLDNYGVDINNCGWENFYYAIDGSTKKPEWQYTCKIEGTNTYYAVVVNAISGGLSVGRTWTN